MTYTGSPVLHSTSFDNAFERHIQAADRKLEADQIAEIRDLTLALLKKRYSDQKKPVLRGVHPKSHGCVDATFEVLPGLDESLRVGLFACPTTFDAKIRYSNAAALDGPDVRVEQTKDGWNIKHGSRGMALKVYDVDSDVLIDDSGRNCQDFLMINSPGFAFRNVADYLRLNKVLLKENDNPRPFFDTTKYPPESADAVAGLKAAGASLGQIAATQSSNPLELAYHGASPFLFGPDRCMHFSAVPVGEAKPQSPPPVLTRDFFREALQETMKGCDDIVFDFLVQVRSYDKDNVDDLHIEDATKSWDTVKSIPVARITIPAPQTGLGTPEHIQECEELVFTPWHAVADHQPLGSINRLRYAIYKASAETRLRAARCS